MKDATSSDQFIGIGEEARYEVMVEETARMKAKGNESAPLAEALLAETPLIEALRVRDSSMANV